MKVEISNSPDGCMTLRLIPDGGEPISVDSAVQMQVCGGAEGAEGVEGVEGTGYEPQLSSFRVWNRIRHLAVCSEHARWKLSSVDWRLGILRIVPAREGEEEQ